MPFKSEKQRKWMHINKPKMAKRWEKEYQKGGKAKGPSHEKGGKIIEVEGGEYVIKKDSVNAETEPVLEKINKTGKFNYRCGGKVPHYDSRKRRK
jgi:hypothetical protein